MDIIIMCSHGYTGMTRWALGSVAEKVASHAFVPVLVLRKGGLIPASPHPDALRPLGVLVALDGSTRAEGGIEPAASLIAAVAAPVLSELKPYLGRAAIYLVSSFHHTDGTRNVD
jgi:nucleotide-binding universal stress UspA family protein